MRLNKVFISGNLTKDPIVREAGNNRKVTHIGVAMNRRYTLADGTQGEETTFVDCEAWGKDGETIAKHMKKGRPI